MHESTTHVNRFVFDSVFSKEKTSFACTMLTVSASRNVLVKLLQFVPQKPKRPFLLGVIEGILFSSQKREYPLTSTNFEAKLHFKCRLCRQKEP